MCPYDKSFLNPTTGVLRVHKRYSSYNHVDIYERLEKIGLKDMFTGKCIKNVNLTEKIQALIFKEN